MQHLTLPTASGEGMQRARHTRISGSGPIETLHDLAEASGIERHWRDADGHDRTVSDATLKAVLAAIGERRDDEPGVLPALIVADCGEPLALPKESRRAEATDERGAGMALRLGEGRFHAPDLPGYYDLEIDGRIVGLAVAPPCAPHIQGRQWGLSVQIPSLRSERPAPFGTFGELADTIASAATAGVDALAINPVHALFPGEGRDFSPYSPSSRIHLNGAMGDPSLAGLPGFPDEPGADFIEWDHALPSRLDQMRALFADLGPDRRERILADPLLADEGVRRHALFDALYCRFLPIGARGWQDWPAAFRDPASPEVARFAREMPDEIAFHLFVQWLARCGLDACGETARRAGMAIGLIGDLAVGVHPGGSDAWGLPDAMLRGLRLGAPPDPLGPQGQEWGITTFSPAGLRTTGYRPFIAMVRAALRGMGGLRIDHAFGLQRMWVVPQGAQATEGAYLRYPFADLVRLVTLEAHRANAIVIAENLGTAPSGFTEAVGARGMLGMDVLWFLRAQDHGFIGAADYSPTSVAMTGTHDTVTVAGWWSGRDLEWADSLGRLPEGTGRAEVEAARDWDRGLLWSTLAHGDEGRPASIDPAPAVDAALAHIAATPAPLALFPLEDIVAEPEQPNLPGTTTEHPNWRRRHAAPTDQLLRDASAAARIAAIRQRRG